MLLVFESEQEIKLIYSFNQSLNTRDISFDLWLFSLSLCLHDVREKGGYEYFKRIKIYSDYLEICKKIELLLK